MKRRLFLATTLSSALSACSPIATALNGNTKFHDALGAVQGLSHGVIGTHGLAREYGEGDIDRIFRVNGLATPDDSVYQHFVADAFRSYRLIVDGAVEKPQSFDLHRLRAMPQVTQITRHDCVEGWSAIGKWSGIRLGDLMSVVRPASDAKYAVFHCMDVDESGTQYYESLDLQQAAHPQTLLALQLNGQNLDPDHGAPVRLRVPTQLGYKSAKWVRRIEFVGSVTRIAQGNGGYWEDQGYEWYAGI